MPELPEVEAVASRVREAAPWGKIVACGQYRPTTMSGAESAVGRRIESLERRGKNILVRLSGGCFLRVHLRMTGNLAVLPDVRLRPVTVRAWFELDDARGLVLEDPRALGRISFHTAEEESALFSALGPEPFDPAFTPAHLVAAAAATPKPIKLLLMEQKAVVGLGNIYAAEALFLARIHPARASRSLSKPRIRALHAAVVQVLRIALDSALAAYGQPGGFREGENFPAAVYGRAGEPCLRCHVPVRRIPQGGRSTYFCPHCQK